MPTSSRTKSATSAAAKGRSSPARSNIITVLVAEHRQVSGLLETLAKISARSVRKRAEVFAEIDQALSKHADFEEERVYPLLAAKRADKPMALEAVEEHGQIKRLLAELRELDPADERWLAKLTVLTEDVRHHVKEEEGELLPKLRSSADAATLGALADEYEEAKAAAGQPA